MKKIILSLIIIILLISLGFLFFGRNVELVPNTKTKLDTPKESFNSQEELNKLDDEEKTQAKTVYNSPISIDYLRSLNIESNAPVIEQELSNGSNYKRYLASYTSEGNKVFGLLTVPTTEPPEGGFSAIVFNHGYIPPDQYVTTEKYVAYVDYLARNGFVVFKIDMRGHGNSEGVATGSYFSSAYTIDALSALNSLQKHDAVNPQKIGMWGHSMAGNLVLRAMLVSDEVKAGVIWAGAVYSYKDFSDYGLSDSSYVGPRSREEREEREESPNREDSEQISDLRRNPEQVNFNDDFWSSISLTQNLNYLTSPLQIHHSTNDPVVNVGYSRDLKEVMEQNSKNFELYEYSGGGHNINSPYFETAMQRTVEFFKNSL